MIGVILGGNTLGSSVGTPTAPGGLAQVCVSGQCQAYVDATTSSSPTNLSASVATPGAGKTLAATTGINVGIILQNVTVTSAYLPQLAQVFVRLS
jgi:predicted RecB family endonuclease